MSTFNVRTVQKGEWKDFSLLFEGKGAPHYCWCCAWREVECDDATPSKQEKRAYIKAEILNNKPVGLLCYDNEKPVGWCAIAPRESYKSLGGDESLSNVWSIVCFFVNKNYRGKGVMKLLLNNAIQYAKTEGARYIEAYPVDPDSPSYRFMGFKPLFEREGFIATGKSGKRRYVMLLKL